LKFVVSEDESISIKEVADLTVKAIGFEGEYTVGTIFLSVLILWTLLL
jgi:hypothetical protein